MTEKIESTILKVFDEKQTRNGHIRIQVIQWGKYSPQLEKREYYFDKDGNEKTGKAKGFNFEDMELIANNIEEIQKLLEN